jgi:hypothetical protein
MSVIDHIELADGSKISTTTGQVVREKRERAAPTSSKIDAPTANELITTRIADLPVSPKQMNGIAAMIVYRLLGMPDSDIAEALGTDVEKIKTIGEARVFTDFFNQVSNQVMDLNSESIRIRFAAMSRDALNKVYEIMTDSDDKNALKAAQDILDRAGHRPADIIMHRHTMEGGLKIEYISRKVDAQLPVIELEG